MNCNPLQLANWNDWKNFQPVDPLDLISMCSLQTVAGTDTGVYLNSRTFATPASSTIPTPEIVGVTVLDSLTSTHLAQMPADIITLIVNSGDHPRVIDITFSAAVDTMSVTSSTFVIQLSGVPVAGSYSFPSSNVARFTATSPLSSGTYSVTLVGSGFPHLTFSGVALDGEPKQLPSGDGTPGGNFTFQIQVVSSGAPPLYPPANIFGWNSSLISLQGLPSCMANGTDDLQKVADANQWNIQHQTAYLGSSVVPSLQNVIFLRSGNLWKMGIPLNFGSLSYPDVQISFRNDAGTRGDCQGTIPAISFTARQYTGNVGLILTLKKLGNFIMGLRVIDPRGNYYMYESTWRIVP